MHDKNSLAILQNSNSRLALGTVSILLIPLLFRWPWGIGDFVFMGLLIFCTGFAINWVASNVANRTHKVMIGLLIIGAVFLFWAELSVDLVSQLLSGTLWIQR